MNLKTGYWNRKEFFFNVSQFLYEFHILPSEMCGKVGVQSATKNLPKMQSKMKKWLNLRITWYGIFSLNSIRLDRQKIL